QASKTRVLPLDDLPVNGVNGENRTLADTAVPQADRPRQTVSAVKRSTVARLSHSATVTLGARSTSRTCLSSFSDWRLDRNGLPGKFGGRGGNRTLIGWLQASSPPVERLPQNWLRAGELNATRVAYDASMTPVHLPASKAGPGSWGRTSGLSIISRVLIRAELFPVEPRARFELAYPDY